MNSIFHRISVRKYQDRVVEAEKIELILKAAMAAPSACNQQPWEFYVVSDKAVIEQLSKAAPYAMCAKNAPLVFVPCYRSQGIAPEYFTIDMSASVQNMLLEADELGLGTVWLGIAPHEERMAAVAEALNLPEELHAFALVPCGYPAKERPQEDRFEISRVHYVGETLNGGENK
jgi:nitroreductase